MRKNVVYAEETEGASERERLNQEPKKQNRIRSRDDKRKR